MAELTPQERLQPALLDRLIDDEPDKKVEARERRIMTKAQLRAAVLRDLAWLFNATRPGGLDEYPQAARSTLNYGLPAFSGQTASTLDVIDMEASIRRAILDFEPRVTPSSLQVETIVTEEQMNQHNVIAVQIRGQLWAQPVPLEMLLRTEVDLETGEVQIRDLGSA